MFKKNEIVKFEGIEYKLKERKGSGGSGTVWTAESNGNSFAIKYINSEISDKIARFKNEISFCKNTVHKNVVKVVSQGEYKEKLCYVMPHYSKTLRDVIDTESDFDKLIKYILKLCNAVKFIHNKGVLHRDIKPENILIEGNELVLADFGIAHFKDQHHTKKSDLLANRNYMAPEQKLKNNAKNIDKAADIYALGLILNECFTKQNPAGSRFKLIADIYPLFFEIDTLVENMMRQRPEDRYNIETVQAQLKFLYKKIKHEIDEVEFYLKEEMAPKTISKSLLNQIVKRASEDILFGKYVLHKKNNQQLRSYNHNWHMKITYSVDDLLFNLYVQEQIFALCKGKFEYESNIYRADNWYASLDLKNNSNHKLLYSRMAEFLKEYSLNEYGWSLLDLSGKILKYFASCSDYHCREILNDIEGEIKRAEYRLRNAPILYIVCALKYGIHENLEIFLNGFNGLAGKFELNFEEHIFIHWEHTQHYKSNDDGDGLLDKFFLKNKENIHIILSEFQKQWNINYYKLDKDYYSINFKTTLQYEKFRKYVLELSKPHYIFEGDVLDIIKNPIYFGNMVELRISSVFEITNTIAQIVGLKEVYA
ncbi:serine/threonine protein kinase [Sphingobacterium sp. ML3W]|uniref:serine/threonine-protein kinase n=1 Tax=Sphingobacterium sp. ML3W TaxID=1538644 RepID=UPI002499FC2F|nr:serine/threonine-protein kinase [Sphingobacterium sp. ML3W]WFA80882.1 serine/threonine protein kinase [Sphingobacterium sp. ML3W]